MKGFTLIEVLIATAIASFLSVGLFVALRQTMGFQLRVDRQADAHMRAALFQNQFEQDFMGFFAPTQAYELVSTKTGGESSKGKAEQIDKVFYGTAKKGQFELLSFITDHAMQVYWGATMGAPKPWVTRVAYRLAPIKDEKDVFILQRQESKELDFGRLENGKEKSNIRAYEIINNVKSMKVTYLARVYRHPQQDSAPKGQAGGESAKQADEKNPTWTYKEFTEWDWSPKKAKAKDKSLNQSSSTGLKPGGNGEEKKKKEEVSRVPLYIIIDLVLWDMERTQEMPFTFVFARKPFEMVELEKDTLETKAPAQIPNIKPVLDILKIPMGTSGQVPQKQVALPPGQKAVLPLQQKQSLPITDPKQLLERKTS